MKFLKSHSLKLSITLMRTSQNVKFHSTNPTGQNNQTINMSYTTYEDTHPSNQVSPLIVMHGLLGSKRNWNSLCKVFNKKTQPSRKILAVDARNHGDSPHTNFHSYPLVAEDVKALCAQLNIERPALLGHSMGGRAMMYFALRYPQLVDRLIVADISPVNRSEGFSELNGIMTVLQEIDLPSDKSLPAARNIMDKQLAQKISSIGLRQFLLTNLAEDSDGKLIWQVNIPTLQKDYSEHIIRFPEIDSKYDGPVLFVSGGRSEYTRKSDRPHIQTLFPNVEFQEIEDAGHWLHSEKPNEFLEICLEFLNRKT